MFLDLIRNILPTLRRIALLTPTPYDDAAVAILDLIVNGKAQHVLQACRDKGIAP